jgi:hypothetical protein
MATKNIYTLPDGVDIEKNVPFTLKKWENDSWKPVARYPSNFLESLSSKELKDLGITKKTVTIPEIPPTTVIEEKDLLYMHCERYREKVEFATIKIMGSNININRESRIRLLHAYIKAKEDSSYIFENWKIRDLNWINLSANEIFQIMDDIEDHTNKCALAEKTINEEILNDTVTTYDQIEKHSLWPKIEE